MKKLVLMVAFILGMAVTFTTQAQDNRSTLLLGVTKGSLNLQGEYTLGVNLGVLTQGGVMVDATLLNVINEKDTYGVVINTGYDVLNRGGKIIKSLIPFVGVSYTNKTLPDEGFNLTALSMKKMTPNRALIASLTQPSVKNINLNMGLMASVGLTKNLDVNIGYGTAEGAKLGLGFRFNSK